MRSTGRQRILPRRLQTGISIAGPAPSGYCLDAPAQFIAPEPGQQGPSPPGVDFEREAFQLLPV